MIFLQFIDEVIIEVKNLWPSCKMVRGSPRHSQSNGGIERINRTVEIKLGSWMHDNNTTRWTVGSKIIQWRINTQINRSIGNVTPYELAFGHKAKVGISSLPISKQLMES